MFVLPLLGVIPESTSFNPGVRRAPIRSASCENKRIQFNSRRKSAAPQGAHSCTKPKQKPDNFAILASIRRRYGRGIPAYEQAKSDWHAANPVAEHRQIERAMRRIAKAVGV